MEEYGTLGDLGPEKRLDTLSRAYNGPSLLEDSGAEGVIVEAQLKNFQRGRVLVNSLELMALAEEISRQPSVGR